MSWEKHLKLFEEATKSLNIERKGKTMPYTSANGHMFSLLNKAGEFGIRLSKADREAFDATYGAKPFTSHGATMRDYMLIPEEVLNNKEILSKYLKKGLDYVMTLEPK